MSVTAQPDPGQATLTVAFVVLGVVMAVFHLYRYASGGGESGEQFSLTMFMILALLAFFLSQLTELFSGRVEDGVWALSVLVMLVGLAFGLASVVMWWRKRGARG